MVGQGQGHRLDGGRVAQHAGLDGVRADIVQHDANLGGDDRRRDQVDGLDAKRVLHGHRRDGAGRIAAEGGDRLDVGLRARAAAGIRAGDRQHAALARAHAGEASLIAPATASACTVSATSWTRTAAAPVRAGAGANANPSLGAAIGATGRTGTLGDQGPPGFPDPGLPE